MRPEPLRGPTRRISSPAKRSTYLLANSALVWPAVCPEKRTFLVVDRPRGIKTAPLGVGAKTKADIQRIGLTMFLAIAAVLVILWALGFIVFHVAGALIHLLIVLALIAVIVHFVMGRKTAGA